ncbi:hypothetical protein KUCAC02_006969, partial [Chaenocephalus aceratus]
PMWQSELVADGLAFCICCVQTGGFVLLSPGEDRAFLVATHLSPAQLNPARSRQLPLQQAAVSAVPAALERQLSLRRGQAEVLSPRTTRCRVHREEQ